MYVSLACVQSPNLLSVMERHTGDHVRRILAIQEERQTQYGKLRNAQERYGSGQCSLQEYQAATSDVTAAFSALSQEILALTAAFRGWGMGGVVTILEGIQQNEQEKLQLTVKWQVLQQERASQEEKEEVEDFGAAEHRKRELRKKLAAVEGAIAELIRDLRFECEPYLLDQSAS